jgi:hypothetical protein
MEWKVGPSTWILANDQGSVSWCLRKGSRGRPGNRRGEEREQQSGFWKDAWAKIDMGSSVIGVFKLMVAELTLFLLLLLIW